MGVYTRRNSPFYWIVFGPPGGCRTFESTRIPIDGGTPAQTKRHKQLAQQAYATRMADLARERYQLPTARPRITFASYRAWYVTHITSQKRGQRAERSLLRQLGQYFDDRYLDAITREDIFEWRTQRGEERVGARRRAPGSVRRELGLLKHLLGTATPKYLAANPAAGITPPRSPNQEPRILSRDEEARLLAQATGHERALIVCALDTLQRLTNVIMLQREQDHETYITVLEPKTGTSYKVPVSVRLRQALDALPPDGPAYFPAWATRPPTTRTNVVRVAFETLCRAADIPVGRRDGGLTFHCLRHTGASRMLEAGVDIETVRRIGGWANYTQLQKYLHPTDEASRAAVESIGNGTATQPTHAGQN